MKNLKNTIILVAMVLVLVGCEGIISSVNPFYAPDDVIYDPALVGQWGDIGPTNEVSNGPLFQKLTKDSYLMPVPDKPNTLYFIAHLFEIKGQRFLDGQLTNHSDYVPAEHLLWKVDQTASTLSMKMINGDWLKALLKTNSGAIQHRLDHDGTNDSDSTIILTADTKDLRAFILKYAADTNAFHSGEPMHKLAGTAP